MKKMGMDVLEHEPVNHQHRSPQLRPIHALNRGSVILEEISHIVAEGLDPMDEELESTLYHLAEVHDADLVEFIAVKFGIVTSAQERNPFLVMTGATVAQRLLDRHRANPEDFREALFQVIEEEIQADDDCRFYDLEDFEDRTFEELEELALLSGNPILEEFLHFATDLDAIFQKRAYLFSYLEHRYSDYFNLPRLTPQYLAVQIAWII